MDKKIKSVAIGPYPNPLPQGLFDPIPRVEATYDDGTKEFLFCFYPDEISFSGDEFTGLTREEAMELRHRKDVSFLQS